MGIRRNIVGNPSVRDAYVEGTLLLKAELSGTTTEDLDIPSRTGVPVQELSTWDLFVYWHMIAMFDRGPGGRNSAHSGPVFLPWHRWMMILLEEQFQRVLDDPDFGLPYWDWAADGEFSDSQQRNRPVWNASTLGGNGRASDQEVTTGPFERTVPFRIKIEGTVIPGQILATNRALRRSFGGSVREPISLPRKADVASAIAGTTPRTLRLSNATLHNLSAPGRSGSISCDQAVRGRRSNRRSRGRHRAR